MRRRHSTNALVVGLLATAGITVVALAVAAGLSVGNNPEARKSPVARQQPVKKESAGKATYANYKRIRDGMTRAEVIRILGRNFEPVLEMNMPTTAAELLQWKQGDGTAIIGFTDGRVTYRSHVYLK